MKPEENLANQERKRREFPDLSEILERPSSAATENYRSTSPMLELIPNKTTDEPKDLILTSTNHSSRPGTPHDSTCKQRLALSSELSQLTLAVQATNTAINNYKAHGMFHSFFIALQLQLQAVYEKDMQHVIGEIFYLPPCDTPACTLFPYFP
ncbi:hypothetical protein TNCV_3825771 [Trichonephila clavipes]|nr:hypothetical protein TNCV_3825771 [Trichonephila clavipes]